MSSPRVSYVSHVVVDEMLAQCEKSNCVATELCETAVKMRTRFEGKSQGSWMQDRGGREKILPRPLLLVHLGLKSAA